MNKFTFTTEDVLDKFTESSPTDDYAFYFVAIVERLDAQLAATERTNELLNKLCAMTWEIWQNKPKSALELFTEKSASGLAYASQDQCELGDGWQWIVEGQTKKGDQVYNNQDKRWQEAIPYVDIQDCSVYRRRIVSAGFRNENTFK